MHTRVLTAAGIAALSALGALAPMPAAAEDASGPPPPAASSAASAPATASDDDRLAAGKRIWSDAACYNCHGTTGGGGHSADFPHGPNLRTSGLDPQTMLTIVECGLPGTRMPAWLAGAYTEIACNGAPLGPPPADVLMSGAYSEDDLQALVDYVQVNFMKQPMPTWSAQ